MERTPSSSLSPQVDAGEPGVDSTGRRSRIWFTVRLLLVLLAAAAILRGREALVRRKSSLPEHRIDTRQLVLHALPPWLTKEDVRAVHRDSGLAEAKLSIFSPDLESRLDAAFRRSPWVRRVAYTRCRPPDRVDVYLELEYGKPLAGVRGRDGYLYLVDDGGVRLPGRRRMSPEGLGRPFRLIEGVETPPPAPGEVWCAAVCEGARVAGQLLDLSPEVAKQASILSVDVSNAGGRRDRFAPEIVLRTDAGTVIEWGRSTLSPLGDLDPDPRDKLLRLARSLEVYQGFVGLSRVKLQFDELIVEELGDRPVQRIPPDAHGG